MNAELREFVRESLARGIARPAIAERLRAAGWPADEVAAALGAWAEGDFPVPVPRRRPYVPAREAFFYLVLFVTLYTTAYNSGAVLFVLLDRWLPDPGQRWESARAGLELARGSTASLIVAFPIFLWMAALIGASVAREPDKRGSKVRKWLTYLTLLAAALVVVGDLIFLVARLLSGELPARVLLKVAVVLAIAGTVFGHFLGQLRRDEREPGEAAGPPRRLPARAAAAVVVVVIAAGLVVSGSPLRERQRRLDADRVQDLTGIRERVASWYQDHARLPASLAELEAAPDWPGGLRVRDPVTGEPYGYRTLDSLRYELCATFDRPDSLAAGAAEGRFWRHPAGRYCYALEVPMRMQAPPRGPRLPAGRP